MRGQLVEPNRTVGVAWENSLGTRRHHLAQRPLLQPYSRVAQIILFVVEGGRLGLVVDLQLYECADFFYNIEGVLSLELGGVLLKQALDSALWASTSA